MKDQIAIWEKEHANFFRLLDLLDAEIRVFHDGGRPDYDLMLGVVDYLIHYPDRHHHPKEDAAIDRLLRKAPEATPLAAELMQEHQVIAQSGAALLAQIQGVMNGVLMPRAAVEATAATYAAYYRQHMRHEQTHLFARLRHFLNWVDWSAIEQALPSEEDPLFAAQPEERYEALHRRIAEASLDARGQLSSSRAARRSR